MWYEQNGERYEAIRHAFAGEDFATAADLVELSVPAMARSRQEATLLRWLQALPDEVIQVRPVLSVDYAGTLLQALGDAEGAEPWLLVAERGCMGQTIPTILRRRWSSWTTKVFSA